MGEITWTPEEEKLAVEWFHNYWKDRKLPLWAPIIEVILSYRWHMTVGKVIQKDFKRQLIWGK